MSSFLQGCGLVLLVVGAWMLAPWVGVAVAGSLLLLVGVALEQRERKSAS